VGLDKEAAIILWLMAKYSKDNKNVERQNQLVTRGKNDRKQHKHGLLMYANSMLVRYSRVVVLLNRSSHGQWQKEWPKTMMIQKARDMK